jgi:hypothetical protein
MLSYTCEINGVGMRTILDHLVIGIDQVRMRRDDY